RSIRVLSNNEHELYLLERKFGNGKKMRYLLGDIRDKNRLKIAANDADIVFHAAALKHVPLCETNPFDAVQTNVIGTQNMLEASISANVEKFVFISTDKAANPMSTLGATKLLAERLAIAAMSYRGSKRTKMYCVRFGNVLGTRGSVVELFFNQIKNKKPITITDKNMTRFTMTPTDAINLILSTVEFAKGGEVFVLKMNTMKISDLVSAMIELYGEGGKQEINEIGVRQGEKMHEELITDEELSRAREFNDMYVIPPYGSTDYDDYPKLKKIYSSNSVTPLSIKEIKSDIKKFQFDESNDLNDR
ncbi:MAG: polysaccharide biosynthesis protein, partial [Nitrososphaeraceae archaeon]